jgi:hypothetical protein
LRVRATTSDVTTQKTQLIGLSGISLGASDAWPRGRYLMGEPGGPRPGDIRRPGFGCGSGPCHRHFEQWGGNRSVDVGGARQAPPGCPHCQDAERSRPAYWRSPEPSSQAKVVVEASWRCRRWIGWTSGCRSRRSPGQHTPHATAPGFFILHDSVVRPGRVRAAPARRGRTILSINDCESCREPH